MTIQDKIDTESFSADQGYKMRISKRFLCFLLLGLLPLHPLQSKEANNAVNARVSMAVTRLEQRSQKQVDDHNLVGLAVAVVHKDKVLLAKGFGWRQTGQDAEVDADTVFQLASVSKPISATVVAALIGEGKISWDSKISDLDPNFQMYDDYVSRNLTIRDLFAHRSGLPEHAGDLLEDMGYNRQQVLHQLRFQKPESSFRSHYAYTNFGLTEGAVAAAKAYGFSWEDASSLKLFKSIGMNSTSSRYVDFAAHSNKALGHVRVDGEWTQKYIRQPDAQSPAGGISSSVNDISRWLRLRLSNGKFEGKQIIAEKPLLETQHPQILTGFSPLNGLPGFYGLGMNVSYDEQGRLRLGHSGGFALGNATAISLVPKEELAVVVLTNCYPIGAAEALTASFIDDALYGKQTQDWFGLFKEVFTNPATLGLDKTFDYSKPPESPSPSLQPCTYTGTYRNDFFGDVSVVEENKGLVLIEGPNKMRFPLEHYNRDTFTYLPPGENSPGRSGITFSIGAGGKANDITIENLNETGQGRFER